MLGINDESDFIAPVDYLYPCPCAFSLVLNVGVAVCPTQAAIRQDEPHRMVLMVERWLRQVIQPQSEILKYN